MIKHHVERTSPKGPGSPFIGTCRLCGMTGLKASAALEDCENVRGLSEEEALVETIIGPSPIGADEIITSAEMDAIEKAAIAGQPLTALSPEDEAVLFATGHLPEDF